VSAALVVLLVLLASQIRRARVPRVRGAATGYLLAGSCAVFGTMLGAWMVSGHGAARDVHVVVNLFGFVGITVASTLPTFVPTQARTRLPARSTSTRVQAIAALLAAAVVVAAIGVARAPWLAAVGLAAYAVGIVATCALLPLPTRAQLRWAGPRLLQLGAGVAWWVSVVAIAAVHAEQGRAVLDERVVVALVVGGYGQILLGSLAYLAPVLRGGGHVRLRAGFDTTRSWVSLLAVNVAAAGAAAGQAWLCGIALVLVVLDAAGRAARLLAPGGP
jgi:nitrite reductase (NO-forming)